VSRSILALLFIAVSSLYADVCPIISLTVNTDSISGCSFTLGQTQDGSAGYGFSGSLDGVTVTGDVYTEMIDYSLDFSGANSTVKFSLITAYSGGPYSTLYSTSGGTFTSDGSATVSPFAGSFLQTVSAYGGVGPGANLVDSLHQNPGCTTAGTSTPCPTYGQVSSPGNISFPASDGTLKLYDNFVLSGEGTYDASGSGGFSSDPAPQTVTPEPVTVPLLAAGILALAVLARRHAKAT
jgi:hypothetical protein